MGTTTIKQGTPVKLIKDYFAMDLPAMREEWIQKGMADDAVNPEHIDPDTQRPRQTKLTDEDKAQLLGGLADETLTY